MSKSVGTTANKKIETGNDVEMMVAAEPISQVNEEDIDSVSPAGSISSNKEEYEDDESVTVDFTLPSEDRDLTGYKIGIFMRMAHPQGGALEPVVSLPLCPESGCEMENNLVLGSVIFGMETRDMMKGSQWPMDLYQWGTGFDVYLLDETGDDVVGPAKFNIMMNDTY